MAFTAPASTGAFVKKYFDDKVALIDADRYKHLVVYGVFLALQEGEQYSTELVEGILDKYLSNDIFNKFQAKAYIFCFSAPSKQIFRNGVAQCKKYKGTRADKVDPYDYEQKWTDMASVVSIISKRYPVLVFDDLEADDLLSMLQDGEKTFIFSHDKDLKQVVGYHYQMDIGQLTYTDDEDAAKLLVGQLLCGDTTDNIPGLQGFGPKALEKFMEECEGDDSQQMLFKAMGKFTEKLGFLHGIDTFVEMWNLVSMKLNRGDYLKEKYASAFILMESLKTK